jgi:hypothetical protein
MVLQPRCPDLPGCGYASASVCPSLVAEAVVESESSLTEAKDVLVKNAFVDADHPAG